MNLNEFVKDIPANSLVETCLRILSLSRGFVIVLDTAPETPPVKKCQPDK